jgi:SAM-dependent methyltransferase
MVTASDNFGNFWTRPLINRHYHVIDDDILRTRLTGPYDLITCVSVLEHIPEADRAVKNMFRLLAPMGYLILTFPYSEHQYVPNVYELPGATYGKDFPYIAQAFSRADLDRWGRDNGAWVLEQEYWQFWEGEFWTVGRQITPPIPTSPDRPHQHTCILFQNCEPCKEESHQIRD